MSRCSVWKPCGQIPLPLIIFPYSVLPVWCWLGFLCYLIVSLTWPYLILGIDSAEALWHAALNSSNYLSLLGAAFIDPYKCRNISSVDICIFCESVWINSNNVRCIVSTWEYKTECLEQLQGSPSDSFKDCGWKCDTLRAFVSQMWGFADFLWHIYSNSTSLWFWTKQDI